MACRRPAVITGGELTLDRLDLALNTVSRVYEAPMQVKAAGGVLVTHHLFAEPANATDAVWAELQAAQEAFDAAYERWEAFND